MTYKEALENIANNWNASVKSNMALVSPPVNKTYVVNTPVSKKDVTASDASASQRACPALPGTLLRISIPDGTALNFLNLIEVASPGGICLVVRLPFLTGLTSDISLNSVLTGMMSAIKAAGGTIEILN